MERLAQLTVSAFIFISNIDTLLGTPFIGKHITEHSNKLVNRYTAGSLNAKTQTFPPSANSLKTCSNSVLSALIAITL